MALLIETLLLILTKEIGLTIIPNILAVIIGANIALHIVVLEQKIKEKRFTNKD